MRWECFDHRVRGIRWMLRLHYCYILYFCFSRESTTTVPRLPGSHAAKNLSVFLLFHFSILFGKVPDILSFLFSLQFYPNIPILSLIPFQISCTVPKNRMGEKWRDKMRRNGYYFGLNKLFQMELLFFLRGLRQLCLTCGLPDHYSCQCLSCKNNFYSCLCFLPLRRWDICEVMKPRLICL